MPSNTNRLRSELVTMLLADRTFALRENNPGAAVAASSRVVDILLGKLAAEEAAKPVTKVTHVLMHQTICPLCRERQPVSATPSPPPEAKVVRVSSSDWDEHVETAPQPETVAVPPVPARQLAMLKIPKTPEQMHRRRRDPTVKGLA